VASGAKNYFRHMFNTHKNEKINKAIDIIGPAAYFYYFTIVELCAEKAWNEDKVNSFIFTFHVQTLRNVWRKQTESCIKVIEKLQESGLFYATFSENLVSINIPNLRKYLGLYQNKNDSNIPIKGKEIKGKERKENKKKEDDPLILEIVNLWNAGALKYDLPQILKSGNDWPKRKSKLKKLIKQFKTIDDWISIFSIAKGRGYTDNEGKIFTPHFDYALRKAGTFYEDSRAGEDLSKGPLKDLPRTEPIENPCVLDGFIESELFNG